MPTISERVGLSVPGTDDPFLTAEIASNWESLDQNAALFIRGLIANRPAAATENRGTIFEATDEGGRLYWSNGTDWLTIDSTPTGVVSPYAGSSTPPPGWLVCNGQAVSRSAYDRLFAVIGTTFGPGNGSTTFNLPDLRGRFLVGAGTLGSDNYDRGTTGGAARVTLATNQLPAHSHASGTLSTNSTGSHGHTSGTLSTGNSGSHVHTLELTRAGSPANNPEHGHQSRARPSEAATHTDLDLSVRTANQDPIKSAGSHSHSVSGTVASNGSHSHSVSGSTATSGSGNPHENRPPFLGLNFIIRT